MITCFIRYEIDPFQRDTFAEYARRWGLIGFDSLAAYEAYRARLRSDAEGRANFAFAQEKRFILREERTFTQGVEGTVDLPAHPLEISA